MYEGFTVDLFMFFWVFVKSRLGLGFGDRLLFGGGMLLLVFIG